MTPQPATYCHLIITLSFFALYSNKYIKTNIDRNNFGSCSPHLNIAINVTQSVLANRYIWQLMYDIVGVLNYTVYNCDHPISRNLERVIITTKCMSININITNVICCWCWLFPSWTGSTEIFDLLKIWWSLILQLNYCSMAININFRYN